MLFMQHTVKLKMFLGKLLWTDDHVDISRGIALLNTAERTAL